MNNREYEYIIIGAGPAGLQAAYYLEKSNKNYVVIEGGDSPGTFFKVHPRHRKLISINKVHTGYSGYEQNMRWDWNSLLSSEDDPHLFKEYTKTYFPSADIMPEYLKGFASKYSLNILYNKKVSKINKDKKFSMLLNDENEIFSDKLIVATGVSKPWVPKIEGVELCKSYVDMSLDYSTYENKKVLILGKGNSAFETADALTEHAASIHVSSPNPLKLAWSTHYVGHLRAINNNFLDTYQLKSQNAVLDAKVSAIRKSPDNKYEVEFHYEHAEGEVETLVYDEVILCTGFRFDDSIFTDECKPIMCDMNKFPVQKNNWESRNIPDLYFAGTIMQQIDYKQFMSGFVHGFRYNVKTLIELITSNDIPFNSVIEKIEFEPRAFANSLINRINMTSSLWQQPGFLVDLVIYDDASDTLLRYEELPVKYVHEKMSGSSKEYYLLSLEFGKEKFSDPFNVSRIARDNTNKSGDSNFLHPIIRRYKAGDVLSEHHVIEDLAAEWWEPEHIEPLVEYLNESLELHKDTKLETA